MVVPIDYISTTGIKLFNSAILKILELFDRESKSVNLFNKKLAERSKQSGYMETGANIIMIADSTGTPRKKITEYGRLTVEDIEANIQKFTRQQTRQAQNSVQLFHCLNNSMTEAAQLKIVAESDKYMEGETPVGEILFKFMMKKAVIDTSTTATYLRCKHTNIDTYMSTVKLDIKNFNQYVKVNVDGLKARGERTNDLMINLFKAYQVSSKGEILRYVKTKIDRYNDGYNLSTNEIMTSALNKFEILMKYNKWNSMSLDQ